MTTTLIDLIDYRDGQISIREGMESDIETDAAEVVETGLAGWGRANAVVLVDGQHYLAVLEFSCTASGSNRYVSELLDYYGIPVESWFSGIDNRGTVHEHPESTAGKPRGSEIPRDGSAVMFECFENSNNGGYRWCRKESILPLLESGVLEIRQAYPVEEVSIGQRLYSRCLDARVPVSAR